MSIVAKLEIEDARLLSIIPQGSGSKAIATFTTPLSDYCHRFENRKISTEIVEWFLELETIMIENLCLIEHATYANWDYSAEEYDRYVMEIKTMHEHTSKQNPPIAEWLIGEPGYEEYLHRVTSEKVDLMTKEEFVQTCQQIEQKWIDAKILRSVINDLIRALEKIQSNDVWWYTERDTLAEFKLLSETLSDEINRGAEQVRIYIS